MNYPNRLASLFFSSLFEVRTKSGKNKPDIAFENEKRAVQCAALSNFALFHHS
jgi:hypothetical protein